MIRKTFFLSLFALTAVMLFAQTTQAEAKSHCRGCSSTRLHVNVGTAYNDTYVTRRYARPVVIPATVYAPPAYYNPYYPPVYAYTVPTYVEEVYVAPAPRPIGLGGFSFSWNFFK